MNIVMHLNIYIFPLILLIIVCFFFQKNAIQTTLNQLYRNLLLITLIQMIMELLAWHVDGKTFLFSRPVIWLFNLICFTLAPLLSLFWMNYVLFYLKQKTILTSALWIRLLLLLPLGIYECMLLSSPWTHWIIFVDQQDFYMRGPYFFIPYVLTMFYLLSILVLITHTYRQEDLYYRKQQEFFLGILSAVPMAASVLQTLNSSLSITLPTTAVAGLIMYIQFQKQQITVDPLTRLNNRGYFNQYLEQLLRQRDGDTSLYLFMIDLDHFKQINDSFGHDVGDQALRQTASILSQFFHRTTAFLARYGGDEFCIIQQCNDLEEVNHLISQLQDSFTKANETLENPYLLACSIGYTKLREEGSYTLEDVIRRADEEMYKNKQRRRRK